MKFTIKKASNLNDETNVEIYTIEDLMAISKTYGSELIVYFKGIANEVDENEIIIYDDYIEGV